MKGKIKVLIKEPNKPCRMATIPNRLKALQEIVGGYIEVVTITTDTAIICNEEGLIRVLPYNCEVCGHSFFGTIFFVGVDGAEFDDIGEGAAWVLRKAVDGCDR